MFTSKSEHHDLNVKQAPTVHAKPAILTAPDVHSVLPITEALRLANEIADAVDAHRISARSN